MVTARVLTNHFARVTIIERDPLPTDAPGFRQGVPQSHHHHVMMLRGRELMEELYPGLDQELAQAGAPLVDYANDCVLFSPIGGVPRFPSGIHIRPCRRILLEWVVRRRTLALGQVALLDGYRVTQLLADADKRRIIGVALEPTARSRDSSAAAEGPRRLEADLVIDATGRRSLTPQWLRELGYAPPEEQVVNPFLGYASRLYRRPPDFDGRWRAVEISARPPNNPRAAGLWEVENGAWLLTLIGTAKQYPPTDEAGFLDFARSLPDPIVYEAVRSAEPLSSIHGHRGTENRWRHYERLARFPQRLLVIGDAVCSFNPIYGQGMTLIAMSAVALDQCLRRLRERGDAELTGLEPRFHRQLKQVVAPAWLLATSDDYRWPTTEGGKPDLMTRLSYHYIDRLVSISAHSPQVVDTFLSVANMVKPPSALLHPRIIGQLLRAALQKKPPPPHAGFTVEERRQLLRQYGSRPTAYFNLQAGVHYFDLPGVGFLSYSRQQNLLGTTDFVFTNPVCADANLGILLRNFLAQAAHPCIFLGMDLKAAETLQTLGYSVNELGVEFTIDIPSFDLRGRDKKYLKRVLTHGRKGVEIRELKSSAIDPAEVERISQKWKAQKQVKHQELQLLTRPPEPADAWEVRKFYCFKDGKMVGYIYFDPFFQDGRCIGYCATITRSEPGLKPGGILDFCLLTAMNKFAAEGIRYLSLGLAPLYDLQPHPHERSSLRHLLRLLYERGNFLYGFKGLAFHKVRYRAQEERVYFCLRDIGSLKAMVTSLLGTNVL